MRRLVSLLCFLAVMVPSTAALAQGVPSVFNLGKISVTPSFAVGYEKLGMSFNLPAEWLQASMITGTIPEDASLDLNLSDSWVWTGQVGLNVGLTSALSLFLKGKTCLPKTITVENSETPLRYYASHNAFGAGQPLPIEWTGERLESYAADVGAKWAWTPAVAVIAGLRYDYLSMILDGARDALGQPLNHQIGGTIPPFWTWTEDQKTSSALMSRVWIPYIGVGLDGPNYHCSILWSPIASATVDIPLYLTVNESFFLFGIDDQSMEFDYGQVSGGMFLALEMDYNLQLTDRLGLRVWGDCRWLRMHGGGDLGLTESTLFTLGFLALREVGSPAQTATYTSYTVGGGIAGTLTF